MTNYKVIRTLEFDKDFFKLDRSIQRKVLKYLKRLENIEEPHLIGKALSGNLKGLWRYRIEDYRLICKIKDDELILLALYVGHRSDVYEKFKINFYTKEKNLK